MIGVDLALVDVEVDAAEDLLVPWSVSTLTCRSLISSTDMWW